jgi:hypothetical protein
VRLNRPPLDLTMQLSQAELGKRCRPSRKCANRGETVGYASPVAEALASTQAKGVYQHSAIPATIRGPRTPELLATPTSETRRTSVADYAQEKGPNVMLQVETQFFHGRQRFYMNMIMRNGINGSSRFLKQTQASLDRQLRRWEYRF